MINDGTFPPPQPGTPTFWNPNEKTIGVLGVAPYATLDFYKKVLLSTTASKDWHHIRLLIDNNPKIPSRQRWADLNEVSPAPYIKRGIELLHKQGADIVVIPCNTAHYFYDEFTKGVNVPVLHMIRETAEVCLKKMPAIKKVGVMASKMTTNNKLYDLHFNPHGTEVVTLKDDQSVISSIIEAVKLGNTHQVKEVTTSLIQKLSKLGAEAVILGCTELSLVLQESESPIPLFDSNLVVAQRCVEIAKAI